MENHSWTEYNGNNNHQFLSEYDEPTRDHSPPRSSSASVVLNASPSRLGYIEHPVSKLDTLAGIAIKYGVEVSDIKKMNGLVTDLQMFALGTLHIPLSGRHPTSDGSITTGYSSSDRSTPEQVHHEQFDSLHSMGTESPQLKISPATTTLQGFYRLKPTDKKTISEGFEMALYRKGTSNSSEDGAFSRNLTSSHRPLNHHRKSRSLVDVILSEIEERSDTSPADKASEGDADKASEGDADKASEGEADKWNDKRVRRRQKSEGNFPTPELLLREDNSSSSGYSSRTGKGLALRQKAASRTSLTTDSGASGLNPVPIGFEDFFPTDMSFCVKKSSSTPCLQDQGNCSSSSGWPTSRWNSSAKPIFDGLPKPITGRRYKAALD